MWRVNLEKELLEGKLSWLLENLSCPVRFLFPSYEQIRLRMSASKSTVEKLGFENKIMDINGNSKDAGKDFDLLSFITSRLPLSAFSGRTEFMSILGTF